MWKMLQKDKPDDYILATGKTETVRNFLKLSFEAAEIEIEFKGSGANELIRDKKSKKVYVTINPELIRPAEVDTLIGNPAKAKKDLNWPAKIELDQLCKMMVEDDLKKV